MNTHMVLSILRSQNENVVIGMRNVVMKFANIGMGNWEMGISSPIIFGGAYTAYIQLYRYPYAGRPFSPDEVAHRL